MEAENVTVIRGGDSLKIEVSADSKDSYQLEDSIHSASNKREISLSRKDGKNIFSSNIKVIIPQDALEQYVSIITTSGNINIDNSNNKMLLAESISGNITISNSKIDRLILNSETGTMSLPNTTANTIFGNYNDKDDKDETKYNFDINNKSNFVSTTNSNAITQVNRQEKTYIDDSHNIKSIYIEGLGVNLVFEQSSDNTFFASLTYPSSLNTWYSDADIQMSTSNQTFGIKILYPNGEMNQTPGNQGNATLNIKLPQKVYDKVSVKLSAVEGDINFPMQAKTIEVITHGVDGDINLPMQTNTIEVTTYGSKTNINVQKPVDVLKIDNSKGTLNLKPSILPNYTNIITNIGEIHSYLPNTSNNFELSINNVGYSVFNVPSKWNYTITNESDSSNTWKIKVLFIFIIKIIKILTVKKLFFYSYYYLD